MKNKLGMIGICGIVLILICSLYFNYKAYSEQTYKVTQHVSTKEELKKINLETTPEAFVLQHLYALADGDTALASYMEKGNQKDVFEGQLYDLRMLNLTVESKSKTEAQVNVHFSYREDLSKERSKRPWSYSLKWNESENRWYIESFGF